MRQLRFAPLALLLIAVLAISAKPAAAQVSVLEMKNTLVQFLLRQIGTPGAFEVSAGEVTEPEDGVTALNDVKVSDSDGVWLTLRQVSFSWTPSALLRGRVEIDRLQIEGLRMLRLSGDPELEGGALAEQEPAEPFSWPRSPIALRVNAFELRDVYLSDRVAPQAIAFDGDGAVVDEGDAQSFRLDLRRTDDVSGRIDLSYERRFDNNLLTLVLEAAEQAGGLVAAAAGLPADSASRVSLRAEGPPRDWRATFTASSDRVFEASATATIAYEGPVSADVDMRLQAGEALDPAVRRALSPSARLSASLAEGDDGVVRIAEAVLSAADLDLTVDGAYGRRDGALDFALQAALRKGLSELLPGAAFESAGLNGRLTGTTERFALTGRASLDSLVTGAADIGAAELDLSVEHTPERSSFSLDGAATGLRIDQLGSEVLGPATLVFRGDLADGRFAIEQAELRSRAATARVEGGADLEGERLDLRYRAAAPDLAPLLAAYGAVGGGEASMDGALSGPFADLLAKGQARVSGMTLEAQPLGEASLSHEFRLGEAVRGAAKFSAQGGAFGEASASASIAVEDDTLTLSEVAATALGAQLDAAAVLELGSGLASGEATLDVRDLRQIGAAVDQPLSGALRAEIAASPRAGAQALSLEAQADRLSIDGRRFASGPVRFAIDDLDAGRALTATLDWALSRRDGAPIGELDLQASGDLAAVDFKADAALRDGGDPVRASAVGSVRASDGETTLRVDLAEALLGQGAAVDAFRLTAPLALRLRGGVASFERLSLSLPRGGELLARLAHAGEEGVAAEAEIKALDLTLLGERFGAPVESGSANASISLDTRPGRATGRLRAEAAELGFGGLVGAGRGGGAGLRDASLSGDWDGERVSVALQAGLGPAREKLAAILSVPLRAVAGEGLVAPQTEPISGSIRWKGEIGDIWPLVPAPDHLLSGAADVDLMVGGSLEAPEISGSAALQGGRYENLALGTILEGLSARSRIDGGSRVSLDLQARAGGGRIAGEVALDLEAREGARVAASVRLTRALLARRDDLTATLSGRIEASGPVAAPRVSGALTIDEAEVRLVAPPGAEIPEIGPVRARGSEPPPPEVEQDNAASPGPRLDISVQAPRRIFTRGRGLEAEWRADLRVQGAASAPRVEGRIERLRGRLDLLGRRFELSRGVVTFNGARKIDPQLEIVFARQANDIEGRVEVTGAASAPEIGFASTPALPEQEVLPRVLFGRSKQSLSAAEAAQLASGVVTLMSGEAGLLDRARALTGLDVLDYGETAGGGEAVTAGRYVGDGVFVGAKQPLDGKGGSAIVEVEVYDGVSVDAEVGQSGGSSVGATWKFDF